MCSVFGYKNLNNSAYLHRLQNTSVTLNLQPCVLVEAEKRTVNAYEISLNGVPTFIYQKTDFKVDTLLAWCYYVCIVLDNPLVAQLDRATAF